jgi:hypothetical protein
LGNPHPKQKQSVKNDSVGTLWTKETCLEFALEKALPPSTAKEQHILAAGNDSGGAFFGRVTLYSFIYLLVGIPKQRMDSELGLAGRFNFQAAIAASPMPWGNAKRRDQTSR